MLLRHVLLYSAPAPAPLCAEESSLCRLCYFNTVLYEEMNTDGAAPGYADCPCCILDIYRDVEAINEDGPRCESCWRSGDGWGGRGEVFYYDGDDLVMCLVVVLT